jgi:hypothetical protein
LLLRSSKNSLEMVIIEIHFAINFLNFILIHASSNTTTGDSPGNENRAGNGVGNRLLGLLLGAPFGDGANRWQAVR